jgi:hypothetical protein
MDLRLDKVLTIMGGRGGHGMVAEAVRDGCA